MYLIKCFLSFVAECSDGGNRHMGTAHSDPSQGRCLQLFNPLFLLSLYFSLPVCLWHPNAAVCLVCSSLFPPCSSVFCLSISLFSLCTERASCSSRMCDTETIVREPRWQETRLRKTEISIHFLTTSFHFLPVGNILFSFTQLKGKKGIDDSLSPCAFCPVCSQILLW